MILSLVFLGYSVFARAEAAPKPGTPWRTYVTILGVSDDTTLEVTLPNEKKSRAMEAGQGFELPHSAVRADAFPLIVQMVKEGQDFKPCQISVEQLTDFDRRYVCTAQGGVAQVQVRVYTNLHGGERFRPSQILAKK